MPRLFLEFGKYDVTFILWILVAHPTHNLKNISEDHLQALPACRLTDLECVPREKLLKPPLKVFRENSDRGSMQGFSWSLGNDVCVLFLVAQCGLYQHYPSPSLLYPDKSIVEIIIQAPLGGLGDPLKLVPRVLTPASA